MTQRQPGQDAVLTAEDITMIRRALCTCAEALTWAGRHGGPDYHQVLADLSQAAGLSRAPGALASEVCLAIDILDFAAPAAGRTR